MASGFATGLVGKSERWEVGCGEGSPMVAILFLFFAYAMIS
jgi:hypothetical protein